MNRLAHAVLSVAVLFLASSSASLLHARDEAKMNEKASAMTKLTAAIESIVLYGGGAQAADDALYRQAIATNPSLAEHFDDGAILVQRSEKAVSVLLCTKDRRQSLLEDASCTAALDHHHWRESPARTCGFAVDLKAACP